MDRMFLARGGVIAAVFAGSILLVDASSLKSLDTDGDGSISLTEAKTAALAKFEALDRDHNSQIDAKEGRNIPFRKIDANHDGGIDKDEYMSAVETLFRQADKDGDGTLNIKEFKSGAGRRLAKLL